MEQSKEKEVVKATPTQKELIGAIMTPEAKSFLKGIFTHQENRCSGRTFGLIEVLMQISLEEETHINLIDHHYFIDSHARLDNFTNEVVNSLLNAYAKEGVHIFVDKQQNWRNVRFHFDDIKSKRRYYKLFAIDVFPKEAFSKELYREIPVKDDSEQPQADS